MADGWCVLIRRPMFHAPSFRRMFTYEVVINVFAVLCGLFVAGFMFGWWTP